MAVPTDYALGQNYPNPFNPSTKIAYSLPEAGPVRLAVYNLLGQEVRLLVDEVKAAGFQAVVWDGRDGRGHAVASGVYLYRLRAGAFTEARKMILLK